MMRLARERLMTFEIFTGHFHNFVIVAIIIGHRLIRRLIICGKSLSLLQIVSARLWGCKTDPVETSHCVPG